MYLTIGFGFDSPGEGVVGCELRLLAFAIGSPPLEEVG
jgi:hypothetical protein